MHTTQLRVFKNIPKFIEIINATSNICKIKFNTIVPTSIEDNLQDLKLTRMIELKVLPKF